MKLSCLSILLLCLPVSDSDHEQPACPNAPYEVSGVVIDAATGEPVNNAWVVLLVGDGPDLTPKWTTGENGRYEGSVVVPLERVNSECREPKSITVVSGLGYAFGHKTVKMRKVMVSKDDDLLRLQFPPLRLREPRPKRRITVRCQDLPDAAIVTWSNRRVDYEREVARKLKRQPKGFGEDGLRAAVEAHFDRMMLRDKRGLIHCYEIHSAQIYEGRDVVGVWTKVLYVERYADYTKAIEDVDFQLWIPAESGWKLRSNDDT
jgi:hypothetical protein